MRDNFEDKAERVLSIYSRLLEGRTVYKAEESASYGASPRTIQRDIPDIQNFLQNRVSETGEIIGRFDSACDLCQNPDGSFIKALEFFIEILDVTDYH